MRIFASDLDNFISHNNNVQIKHNSITMCHNIQALHTIKMLT